MGGSNSYIVDNNAFLFSFLTRKIYNAKKDKKVISDFDSSGPCFNGDGGGVNFIPYDILEVKANTKTIS